MPEITDSERTFDSSIQSADIAFKQDEMVDCRSCGRANPPNRFNCIYCAYELEVSPSNAAAVKFIRRKLEPWERAINVILETAPSEEQNIRLAAEMLDLETNFLTEIVKGETALPVARVESEKEAVVIRTRLEEMGFACSAVSDEQLAPDKPHVRLSGAELADQTLNVVTFNKKEEIGIAWSDLVLIVSGVLTTSRVDALEKKRRRGETKPIHETTTSSDEQIFDIYTRNNVTGFRVHYAGFDFSCLGSDKGLLASENMRLLVAALKRRAPGALFVDTYAQLRHLLNDVWEIESRKDFHGLQRSGFGKIESASAASTSNLTQFNKFSRLQFHLR